MLEVTNKMSKIPFIAQDEPGKEGIAMGNIAIARGAYEAGVDSGSGYPGTPSSEIMENFKNFALMSKGRIKVEWSINEKVGFEVGYGASMCNVRSLVTMKHVGVNVASDSFFSACYGGVKGGLVLISADDPTMHSSQNEQDNRFYGLQGLVPIIEPANIQEAKDMTKFAFEFSEKFGSLVILRTTTRINHARGNLKLGEIEVMDRDYKFDTSFNDRWTHSRENSLENRKLMNERLAAIAEYAEDFPFNKMNIISGAKVGVIASGIPYSHALDALHMLGQEKNVSTFKLGMVFPYPKKKLAEFLKSHDKIIIVEELEPVFEEYIQSLAFEECIDVEIIGKDLFPQQAEFYPETIIEIFSNLLSVENPLHRLDLDGREVLNSPPRPPVLCPGCGHRSIYTALRQIERRQRKRFIHSSDIGCYTLGYYEPLNAIDTCICMGGSIGLANGFVKIDERETFAFLGDSTFYHSGIAGVVNAVANDNDIIVVIMNNLSTCMTGHQDHPGTGTKITQEPGIQIDFVESCKGIGVKPENIFTCNADRMDELETAFESALKKTGVRVIIPESLCALLKVNWSKKGKIKKIIPMEVHTDMCCEGEYCLRFLGCPAMSKSIFDGKIQIDTSVCAGCTMCTQICPYYAIKPKL